MEEQPVVIEVGEGVMVITLNRPSAKNAANGALARGVSAAIDQLESDDDIRVAIITGAGGTFCSGMDLKAYIHGEDPRIEGRGFAGLCEYTVSKPLIAAVEGYALAGGFEMVISCDLIVAAKNATFGIPETKRGLVAGAGGLVRLPKQIPPKIAKEWALTGDMFTAQRAYEIGLINQIVGPGQALAAAKSLAERIASNGPLAVAISKKVLDQALDWSNADMFREQEALIMPVLFSEDAREGATAFAEKRRPAWKGK